jgi:hypothetical protein
MQSRCTSARTYSAGCQVGAGVRACCWSTGCLDSLDPRACNRGSVLSALQAVKCKQGKCQGFLLEQRPNNITDGQHWVCTACARSVPSHPPSGSSSLRPRAAGASVIYPAALQDSFKRLWNEAVAISNQKVRHSLRVPSCWEACMHRHCSSYNGNPMHVYLLVPKSSLIIAGPHCNKSGPEAAADKRAEGAAPECM